MRATLCSFSFETGILFGYLDINKKNMLTSIEIAKLLKDQKKKSGKQSTGFDDGLMGLGVVQKLKNRKKS